MKMNTEAQAKKLILSGQKLRAIKLLHDDFGMNLKESKKKVEATETLLKQEHPAVFDQLNKLPENEMICDLQAAKAYFLTYDCRHFHMCRDYPLKYESYKILSISEEQESEWRNEFQKDLLNRLVNDPCDGDITSKYLACMPSSEQDRLDPLIDVLEMKKGEMDTFSKILCAERILDFLKREGIRKVRRTSLKLLGIDLLESAMCKPSDIDDRYRNTGYVLKDTLLEDRILKRVSKALDEMKLMR